MKRIIVKAILIIIILIVGYFLIKNIFERGYRQGFSKAFDVNKKCEESVEKKTDKTQDCDCSMASECWNYKVFDADGDGWATDTETVIIESDDSMSQFAGRVLVIDDGKVVFTSKTEMRINVKPINDYDYNNGFVISYSTEPNSNTAIVKDFYKYINGKYILEKTENN